MSINGAKVGVACQRNIGCVDKFGCYPGICPDFTIKRHDTKPSFKVLIEDCDGALDLSSESLVLEVNMWAFGKLKKSITVEDTYFALADNIGFEQIMVNDIILVNQVRSPEYMLVTAFDEANKLIQVERGYFNSVASAWNKGTEIRILRILNAPATIEIQKDDITQADGTILEDQIVATYLVYDWRPEDTCLPGCFWLEFKLLKMEDVSITSSNFEGDEVLLLNTDNDMSCCQEDTDTVSSVTPSFTPSLTPADYGCTMGDGVEWVRRFPLDSEGFLIKIINSPTSEIS